MASTEIMTKYKASQGKVAKLRLQLETIVKQIEEEETSQQRILVELQTALSAEIGKAVRITGNQAATSGTARYNKNDIIALIDQMKNDGYSFENIACRMNDDGNFRPKSALKFTSASVYQLYKASHPKASAGTGIVE